METDTSDPFKTRVQERLAVKPGRHGAHENYDAILAAEVEIKRKLDNQQLSKEELLHHLRGWREAVHRMAIQNGFDNHTICWNAAPGQSMMNQGPTTDMKHRGPRVGNKDKQKWWHDFFELANKSVPFYVLDVNRNGTGDVLRRSLCGYFYAKWFRPYTSDIEFNQFPVKMIVPVDMTSDGIGRPSAEAITALCMTTKALSHYIDRGKHHMIESIERSAAKDVHGPTYEWPHNESGPCLKNRCEPNLGSYDWQFCNHYLTPQRLKRHYARSPLFRSVGIVLCMENVDKEADSSSLGKTSVCLFLTGETSPELSAPVTFDGIEDHKIQAVLQRGSQKAIQTTLDTAIDFIIALETREASAVKDTTDAEAATFYATPRFPKAYDDLFEGDPILTMASSKWVNEKAYTKWTGKGALLDYQEYMWEKYGSAPTCVSGHMLNATPRSHQTSPKGN